MPDSLRLYDKDIQEKYPNNRVSKHIYSDDLNKAINDFIETGDVALGIELIRYLHWDGMLCKEGRRIISEQITRFQSYEAYQQMEEELDLSMVQKVTWDKLKTNLLNELFFVFQNQHSQTLAYSELKNLLSVMGLPK